MPSPVCVIFSTDKAFLSGCGSGIVGGECKMTNSLNITDEPRRRCEVGGLNKLELAEFCWKNYNHPIEFNIKICGNVNVNRIHKQEEIQRKLNCCHIHDILNYPNKGRICACVCDMKAKSVSNI